MKPFRLLLLLFGFPLGIFGYWGLYTKAGRQSYDEMAGIIPTIALLTSVVFLVIAAVLSLVIYLKRK